MDRALQGWWEQLEGGDAAHGRTPRMRLGLAPGSLCTRLTPAHQAPAAWGRMMAWFGSPQAVPASHLVMGYPWGTQLWGAWPWGTQLWASGHGHPSSTQPWDAQRGVSSHRAAARGTSPPAQPRPSLTPLSLGSL